MTVETVKNREVEPQDIAVRKLTPDDYHSFNELAQSAWPGIKLFSEPIFVALTDQGVSVALTEGQTLVGASFNFIKPTGRPREYCLYVHMLGTRQDRQGQGIGKKVMQENYRLITSGELGDGVTEVKLTSDPLEAKNVLFYLHHLGMTVHQYKPEAYKTLSTTGAEQHKGLPADRFVYTVQPGLAWANQRQLPTSDEYVDYVLRRPEALKTFGDGPPQDFHDRPPLVFVEVPQQIATIKQDNLELAIDWRRFQQQQFEQLFSPEAGYSAVDAVVLTAQNQTKQFIVCLRDFDESNPECISQSLSETD